MIKHIEDGCVRMVKAISNGWGFQYLQRSPTKTGRHSLWVHDPNDPAGDGWRCHKVSGDVKEKDLVDALLDEAGVPK